MGYRQTKAHLQAPSSSSAHLRSPTANRTQKKRAGPSTAAVSRKRVNYTPQDVNVGEDSSEVLAKVAELTKDIKNEPEVAL
eukprot:1150600-Pelagomonas_calceolata.AAC.1